VDVASHPALRALPSLDVLLDIPDLLPRFIPRYPVTLLQATGQVFAVAFGLLEVVIRELAPLFLELAGKLFPLAFHLVFVHELSRKSVEFKTR